MVSRNRKSGTLPARLGLSEGVMPIAANASWMMANSMLRMAAGVLVGAWIARYLGPSLFGELSYAVAFVAFFQAIGKLGLDSIVVRDLARDAEAAPSILGTAFRLRLAFGAVSWIAAIGGMALLRPGDATALVLVAIVAGTVMFQAADTVDLWFQSRSQSKRTVLAKTTGLALASAVRVALILLKAPLEAFAAALLIEVALSALALGWAYRHFRASSPWHWQSTRAVQLLKESWPFLLSSMAILVYMRIDQLMLRSMAGLHELGIYSAALPLSTAWYFIPIAICGSVAPALARKKARSEFEYMALLHRLFSLMWWFSVPLCVMLALLSGPLISLLYGAAYSASAAVLSIHVFANIPVALGTAQSQWIANEGRGPLAIYKTTLGAGSNVLLNLWLIPDLGAVGASIATVASFFISAIFSNLFFSRAILIQQISSLFKYRKA